MTTLSIQVGDQQMRQLMRLAAESGRSPEELLSSQIEEWLKEPAREFSKAAEFVLKKNAELYRRLA